MSVLDAGALGASHRPLTDVMAHALGSRSAALVSAIALTGDLTLIAAFLLRSGGRSAAA